MALDCFHLIKDELFRLKKLVLSLKSESDSIKKIKKCKVLYSNRLSKMYALWRDTKHQEAMRIDQVRLNFSNHLTVSSKLDILTKKSREIWEN